MEALHCLEQGWAYLENFISNDKKHLRTGRIYRLERMRQLAAAFDYPQLAYRIFHIAGSKGKGSAAVLLAQALAADGSLVGFFTSPHICSYRERVQLINGLLDDQLLLEEIKRLQHFLESKPNFLLEPPTFFELITLLALNVFRRCACEYVVLEVGLGGRLDATNIVDPYAALIMPIELEHCSILGYDLSSVAREKAGIIKPGKPVFVAHQEAVVRQVLCQVAAEKNSPIFFLDDYLQAISPQTFCPPPAKNTFPLLQKFTMRWRDGSSDAGQLRLHGQVQVLNAALVLLLLRRTFPTAGEKTQQAWLAAFSQAYLPGHCHFISGSPSLCLDGAHTILSIKALLSVFLPLTNGQRRGLIFASLPDKDYLAMAALLAVHFNRVLIPKFVGKFKEIDHQQIVAAFSQHGIAAEVVDSPAIGLSLLRGLELDSLLVTGSFYLVGELLQQVL